MTPETQERVVVALSVIIPLVFLVALGVAMGSGR